MNKVWGTAIGCVLVAGSLMTGCSSSKNESGGKDGKIVLNMAWWGNTSRAKVTNQAVKVFEKEHPKIQVNVSYAGYSGYFQKLPTEISGGNGPDVMQQDVSTIASYAQRGSLLPLSKQIINTSSMNSAVLQTGVIAGKLYGIPSGVEGMAVFYNPVLLKKAGVTIKQNAQLTWIEYAQIANQVTQKLPGVYGTSDQAGNETFFQYYLREKGENEYTTDGKLGFDKQSLVDWLNYWAALRKSGAAPPASYTASQANVDEGHNAFAIGKTPFFFDFSGDSAFNDYESYLKHPLGMMMVPALSGGKEGNYPRPTMYWSVNAKTQYPKQAQELVDFLTNNVTAGKLLGLERGVPVSTKVADAVHKSLPADQETAWSAIQAELKVATPMSPLAPADAPQVSTVFSNITQANEFGKMTADQAADQFFTQVNGILNQ